MKVPVYEQQARPNPGGVPERITSEPVANWAGALSGFDHAGDTVGQIFEKARKEADQKADDDLLTQGTRTVTSVMHGDEAQREADARNTDMGDPGEGPVEGNADGSINADALAKVLGTPDKPVTTQNPTAANFKPNGFLQLEGDTAVEHSVPTQEYLQKELKRIADSAPNERVKASLLHKFALMYADADRQIESHASKQREVAQEASAKALMATSRTAVTLNPEDDTAAALEFSKGEAAATLGAKSEADKAARSLAWHGELASDRLKALIDKGDFTKAEAVLTDNRQALGVKADPFEKTITDHKTTAHAQAAAQAFVETSMDPKTGQVDEMKLNKLLATLPDGELRKKADGIAAEYKTRAEQAFTQQQKNTSIKAFQAINTASFWTVPESVRAALNESNPALYHTLKQEALHRSERVPPPTPEQQRAMTQFEVDLHDHPEKYATMPEPEFNATVAPFLSRADRSRAGALFGTAHGATSKPGALTGEENKMLLQQGRKAGLFPDKQNDVSKWDDDQAKLYYAASQELTDKITGFRRANGKPPDSAQVQKWVDSQVIEGKVPGSGLFGSSFFEDKTTALESRVKGTAFAPAWSDDEKAKATAALKAKKLPVNDASVDALLRKVHGVTSAPISPPAPSQAAPEAKEGPGAEPDHDADEGTPDIPSYGD